jgi:hypothetical protein
MIPRAAAIIACFTMIQQLVISPATAAYAAVERSARFTQ